MPSYFQTISEDRFNADTNFVVKESKTMHLVIGLVLLVLSAISITSSIFFGVITGVFGTISLIRSGKDITVMKIDTNGFYYYGSLVTSWSNFVSARFVDEVPLPTRTTTGVSDKFYLVIRYYKNDHRCYERKIPFTNTQDKSEEEIMAAINFYYKHRQISNGA